MRNRLELLRDEVDRLIFELHPENCAYFISHLYGVQRFCCLLALRRGLDADIAAACGLLHDIYQVTAGTIEEHALKGAVVAEEILRATALYSDDEISIITAAISNHSKKKKVHEPYDEVLKDGDVLDHCLCNPGFPVIEKEAARYEKLLIEFGCSFV